MSTYEPEIPDESDPEAKQMQQIHFFKNVSLLGGLMIAAADTHGKPSAAYRSRVAAERAQHQGLYLLAFLTTLAASGGHR